MKIKILLALVINFLITQLAFSGIYPLVDIPKPLIEITKPSFVSDKFTTKPTYEYMKMEEFTSRIQGSAIDIRNHTKSTIGIIVNGKWATWSKDGKDLGIATNPPARSHPSNLIGEVSIGFKHVARRGDILVIAVVPLDGENAFKVAQVFCVRFCDFIGPGMQLHKIRVFAQEMHMKPLDKITSSDIKYMKSGHDTTNIVRMAPASG